MLDACQPMSYRSAYCNHRKIYLAFSCALKNLYACAICTVDVPSCIGNILLTITYLHEGTVVTRLSYNSLYRCSISLVISALTDRCNGQQEMLPNGSHLMVNVSVIVQPGHPYPCADSSYDGHYPPTCHTCHYAASLLIKRL